MPITKRMPLRDRKLFARWRYEREVLEGERSIVLLLIGQRFGPVSAEVRKRIEALYEPELTQMALRLLDARNLDELLN